MKLLTQADLLDALESNLACNRDDTPLLVVTGSLGTGKSFVLRLFARYLSGRLLNSGERYLPLMIPLEDRIIPPIKAAPPRDGLSAAIGESHTDESTSQNAGRIRTWNALFGEFLAWANSISDRDLYCVPALEKRFHADQSVLILDSVDEFLMNNAWIRPEDFRAMVRWLRDRFRAGRRMCIILGIRKEEPILQSILGDADKAFEVAGLSKAQAKQYFRGIDAVVDRAFPDGSPSPETGDVLLTPLILKALEDVSEEDVNRADLRSRTGLLNLAIKTILKKSRVESLFTSDGQLTTWQTWLDALTLGAFIHVAKGRPPMSAKVLTEGVRDEEEFWAEYNWPSRSQDLNERMQSAFALLRKSELCDHLLSKSVFVPMTQQQFRFQHRIWFDFLFGRHLSWCIASGNLLSLARAASTLDAFRIAADELRGMGMTGFTEELIEQAIVQFNGPEGHVAIGNLAAIIGNSHLVVEPAAMNILRDYFLNEHQRTTCIDEHRQIFSKAGDLTFTSAICHRIILNQPNDPSHEVLKNGMTPLLQAHLQRVRSPDQPRRIPLNGNEKVLASLSWCLFSAFPNLFHIDEPLGEWPGLELTEEEEREVLDRQLALRIGNRFEVRRLHHTIQWSFLSNQISAIRQARTRPPGIVHYLFTLSLVVKHRLAVEGLRDGLRPILYANSEYAAAIRSFPLPELSMIYDLCRRNAGFV